jgi:hypothetical protein
MELYIDVAVLVQQGILKPSYIIINPCRAADYLTGALIQNLKALVQQVCS